MQAIAITRRSDSTIRDGGPERNCWTELQLPPLLEQRRIVAKVEQLMALMDHLEARLTASHESAGKPLDTVVAELSAAPHFT